MLLAAAWGPINQEEGIPMAAEFELYKDNAGEFRWRLQAGNNEIIADSGEGYSNKADCEYGIELVRTLAPTAPINDMTINDMT